MVYKKNTAIETKELITAATDKDIAEADDALVSWEIVGSAVDVVVFSVVVGLDVVVTTVVLGVVVVGSPDVAGVVHGSLVVVVVVHGFLVVGASVPLHPTLGNTQPQAPV